MGKPPKILWQRNNHSKAIIVSRITRLNITLSYYFDVAPDIIDGSSLSETSQTKQQGYILVTEQTFLDLG